MNLENVARSMKLIFIGIVLELVSLPAFLSNFGFNHPVFSLFNIAYIIGLILELIAILRLKNESKHFNNAFVLTIATICAILIGLIVSMIALGNGSGVLGVVATYIIIAADILNLLVSIYVISGAIEALNQNGDASLAELGSNFKGLIAGGFTLSAILTFVLLLPTVANNNVASMVLGIILIIVKAATFLANFFFVFKAYKSLSKEEI